MKVLATCPECTCCTHGSCTVDGRFAGYCRPSCPCPAAGFVFDADDADDADDLDEF